MVDGACHRMQLQSVRGGMDEFVLCVTVALPLLLVRVPSGLDSMLTSLMLI